MRKFRVPESREQVMLLPRTVDEFVPADDIARYIDAFVDELDLSKIEGAYSSEGRPGFCPAVMLKILVYGKLRGMRSCRELARAVNENLKFIYLASGEHPDFRTIALFRKRFHRELAQILQQTIEIGLESGAIDLEHVAIDGTLIPGFANAGSFKSPEYLTKYLAYLEKSLDEDIKDDDSDDPDDFTPPPLPKALQNRKELTRRVRAALKQHVPGKIEQCSTTDPDCRKAWRGPAYSGQAAVDEHSRMVVGGYATNTVTDSAELVPVLRDVEQRTSATPKRVTADGGYKAQRDLVYLQEKKIEGYIPQARPQCGEFSLTDFSYHQDSDSYTCPAGRALARQAANAPKGRFYKAVRSCADCQLRQKCLRKTVRAIEPDRRNLFVSHHQPLIEQMQNRVASEIGQRMRKKRSSTVETVFAHLKYLRKLTRFTFRGLAMVNSMWLFDLAVYNIERLLKLRRTSCPA